MWCAPELHFPLFRWELSHCARANVHLDCVFSPYQLVLWVEHQLSVYLHSGVPAWSPYASNPTRVSPLSLVAVAVCAIPFQTASGRLERETRSAPGGTPTPLCRSRMWVDCEHYHIFSPTHHFNPQRQVGEKNACPIQNMIKRAGRCAPCVVQGSICECA